MGPDMLENHQSSTNAAYSKKWLSGLAPRFRCTWPKWRKHAPIVTSLTEKPNPKTNKF